MNEPVPLKSELDLANLAEQLDQTMLVDRHRLERQLRALHDAQRAGKPFDRNLARWQTEVEQSQFRCRTRFQSLPKISYDDVLPIVQRKADILAAIRDHQVVVICGETGSGKSTQLPKLCLELGRGIAGSIGHTQPRRIAARSVASRIAEELQVPLGKEVGFKVRFSDATGPNTLIKLLTDGMLLAETQTDRWLNQYDTLIIDEAHERSLNIDFVLGYVHRLLPKRRDLKLIITSATIDAERFAAHFADVAGTVPVLEVSGRTYPVEIRYRPLDADDDRDEPDVFRAIASAVNEVTEAGPGDVLVFLPTERDIHEAAKVLRGRTLGGSKPEILPLYARLSVQEQQRVFHQSSGRRIVLATNVAESSLTVPGIRYVVDTGTARISVYSPRTKLQRLPIERISQASANQRAGRCGRVGPGICIRLYSAEDYSQRDQFTPPEILRSNLAAVILQTECLGLGAVHEFPFLEPPKPEAIRDGYKTLFELGAVDAQQKITPIGRTLHRLPVDPRIGRIVLAGIEENCLTEILVIASALEAQDPRDRPLEKQQQADEAHAKFIDRDSDFVTYLRMWDFYHKLKDELTKGQLRKACPQNFLSFLRLKEWTDLHRELVEVVEEFEAENKRKGKFVKVHANYQWPVNGLTPDRFAAIHRALLTGFLSGIANRTETGEYVVAGGAKSWLWPGSGLAGKQPKWIVSAESIETTRRFLRTAARIDPAWIEALAGDFVNRVYSDPGWDPDQLAVLANEKVTLWGLPIVPRRRVHYAKIDFPACRQLFLQDGLLAGNWPNPPPFLAQNLALIQTVEERQARLRQPAQLKDEDDRLEFYAQRVPADICDGQALKQWIREHPAEARTLLMTEADVLHPTEKPTDAAHFPDTLEVHGLKLPLKYEHNPGAENDGVTVSVPQAGLNQLNPARLAWLVPGMLEEKITALLRSLPKEHRRELSPIPETAHQIAGLIPFGAGELTTALAHVLRETMNLRVTPQDFEESRVPDFLHMRIEVIQPDGQIATISRDLLSLQQQFGATASTAFAALDDKQWSRDGITKWDFGTLPDVVAMERFGVALKGYPTLLDQQTSVALRLWDAPEKANYELRFGLRRLIVLALPKELKSHVDHLPHLNSWTMVAKTFPQPCPLREHLAELIADRACLADKPLPRTIGDFGLRITEGRQRLSLAAAEVVHAVAPIFESMTQIRKLWEKYRHAQFQPTLVDVHNQLARLLAPGFFVRTPWNALLQYPRYFQAIVKRLNKLNGGGHQRDQQLTTSLQPLWKRCFARLQQHEQRQIHDPALEIYRWMLEEYRVLLFAQELGTMLSVSEKKLEKQWDTVRS